MPDFRGPDSIRLGVAPLYGGSANAMDGLRAIVERGEQREVDAAPAR